MKVLVVDDSSVSREHLSFLVGAAGHEAIGFESADSLLKWSQSEGLDDCLILLDWVMPEMEGPELCRMIRTRYADANIYIIMASSKSDSADVAEGLGAGADDYVSKPFSTVEVTARLEVGVRTLRLRAELAAANKRNLVAQRYAAVGQLAAGAAHEINNPLGFLKSNISLFQKELPQLFEWFELLADPDVSLETLRASVDLNELQESFEDYTEMLVDMRSGVDRIRGIVTSLQSFTADVPAQSTELDIETLLQSWVGEGVKLEVSRQAPFRGDRSQLEQLVKELVSNARWATQSEGGITVSLNEVGAQMRLVISDTGCGIEASDLGRVTDPFFTTKPVGAGLGMGLSRAQAIVRNHGGEMHLTSVLGKGTQVVCELPRT